MKKLFYILALLISFFGTAQQIAGPQKIIDVPIASGSPDVMTRDVDLITKRITFSSFASMIASSLNTTFYPFASNPAGYLTQRSVLEFADLASFPITGVPNTIYIANNNATTGVPIYYTWNGSSYVTTVQPVTGITGSGTVNRIPRFGTPTTLVNSSFSDNGLSGRYTNSSNPTQYVEFLNNPNAFIRIFREQSRLDFGLGNAGFGVLSTIYSSQGQEGLEILSDGDFTISSGSSSPGTGAGGFNRFYINRTTGNVGIGTGTTASQRLHVSGNARITGGLFDSTNSQGTSGQVLTSNASGNIAWANASSGSVTNFLFTNANGITGSVTNPTTTPTLVLSLGAITPTAVNVSSATASTIAEFDSSKNLISASKGTAYNKNFGTGTTNVPEIGATLNNSHALATDASGKIVTSAVTATELGYSAGVTSAIQPQINSKVTDNVVVDYSATSTVVGWSSFTTKSIKYLIQGKITHVWVYLEGPSNSTDVSFTIPTNHNGAKNYQSGGWSYNNSAGLNTAPRIELTNGSNVVTVSRLMSNTGTPGSGWTASAVKGISAYFTYEN